jgi:serpin B
MAMKRAAALVAVVMAAGVFAGAAEHPAKSKAESNAKNAASAATGSAEGEPTDAEAVVEGNNAFAVALYGQLRGKAGNLFFSPESISTALAMTYAGARGDTATGMAKAMDFRLPVERLNPAMGALLKEMNAAHADYQLSVANALWAAEGYELRADYLKQLNDNYDAGVEELDFKNATEAARTTINQWVAKKTAEKIQNLLAPGVLTKQTRLVLTNAIYFKGTWRDPFAKGDTKPEDFHLAAGKTVKAELMHREGGGYRYADEGTFQALEIPYKGGPFPGGELSMIVLLPREADGLGALEAQLTAENAKTWIAALQPARKVIVTMPRFKMTQEFQLEEPLTALGMGVAFDKGKADFSGMTETKGKTGPGFVISAVIHKAYVDVNEEGTEAAAATAVVMVGAMASMRPPPTPVFRADHPFVFLIRDNKSGGILFMGRVEKPE